MLKCQNISIPLYGPNPKGNPVLSKTDIKAQILKKHKTAVKILTTDGLGDRSSCVCKHVDKLAKWYSERKCITEERN
jgi:hypothetical protein